MKQALIFAAGKYDNQQPDKNFDGMIIAADGGLKHCKAAGFEPDHIIGDFDSLGFIPQGEKTVTLPKEKDETDLEAALAICKKENISTIYIYGALGGRIDHMLGNISLLARLAQDNVTAYMYGENSIITAVTNGTVTVTGNPGDTVSIIAWNEEAYGVTETGFKYKLCDHTVKNTVTLGISNEMLSDTGKISVKDGTLIIIKNIH